MTQPQHSSPQTAGQALASQVPLQLEPIVRPTPGGLRLESVEIMAGGAIAGEYAARGALLELDILVAESVTQLALRADVAVHLNLPRLDGHVVHHARYLRALAAIARHRRLVLEIHETTYEAGFQEARDIARRTGAELAIDDLAPGNLGWKWTMEAVEEAIASPRETGSFRAAMPMVGKVDVAWFHHAMQDPTRWEMFCRSLRRFSLALDVIIVEGVETLRHLDVLRGLVRAGLPLGLQGYLINALYRPSLGSERPTITCRQRARG
jgi:EAL domain-containing protein (putative c-di-GMP-specific phosphodiesterase class I)